MNSRIMFNIFLCSQNSLYPYISLSRPYRKRGAGGVTVMVVKNGLGNPSSNLDRAVCISLNVNTLWKGMNPTILPPPVDK